MGGGWEVDGMGGDGRWMGGGGRWTGGGWDMDWRWTGWEVMEGGREVDGRWTGVASTQVIADAAAVQHAASIITAPV